MFEDVANSPVGDAAKATGKATAKGAEKVGNATAEAAKATGKATAKGAKGVVDPMRWTV
jgi:hypothetical protein